MPQDWTDRDDQAVGCCPAGPVANDDGVYRMLRKSEVSDGAIQDAAFKTQEIVPPTGRPPQNMCGEKDGLSVMRRGQRDDVSMSDHALAYLGADAWGLCVASVAEIRSIRALEDASAQLFFVYEDPTVTAENHAVIRFVADGPKPAKAYKQIARAKLRNTFRLVPAS